MQMDAKSPRTGGQTSVTLAIRTGTFAECSRLAEAA